jgi:DnaK suppressor protein
LKAKAKTQIRRKSPGKTGKKTRVAYVPSESEAFMNRKMREYFRRRLLEWRAELLRESGQTLASLQQESLNEADLADRATLETDRALELRTRERYRKLVSKIEDALRRIADGTYGYCEETLSLEAQELHERMERTHRDE